MKKGEIVLVEGCPCEALEWAEYGVVCADADTELSAAHRLVVAPDGTLLLARSGWVSVLNPSCRATERRLRRLARALA